MPDQIYEPLSTWSELPEAEMLAQARSFLDLMKRRRTVRDFAPRPVPRALIESALLAAGTAPSGANQQPWHFAVITSPEVKREIRIAAEAEERDFYAGRGGEEWLNTLKPLGTDADKPFLEVAPVLIAIFAQRYGVNAAGRREKHYYVSESVGIATGILITALHRSGLATLTHTPSPMGFLNRICDRPSHEKPFVLLVAGYPAPGCRVPRAAGIKKPLAEIATFL
ncbi:MAG: nitroreductase family protein [Alphaproteobacteria bacterium]|nr:nitroreductase family protein [Alphaproteobacteria bacterium]